jgi:hypothetical protein
MAAPIDTKFASDAPGYRAHRPLVFLGTPACRRYPSRLVQQPDGVLTVMPAILMIFLNFLFWSLMLPAYGNSSEQAACSEITSHLDPSGIGGLPIGDQGPTGLCYAYSAVALIDSMRLKNWIDSGRDPQEFQHTSVMDAAILYILNETFDDNLNGGNACTTVNAILSQGACVEDEFYSEERAPYRYAELDQAMMNRIERYRRAIRSGSASRMRRTHRKLDQWLQEHLSQPTGCMRDTLTPSNALTFTVNDSIIERIAEINGCSRVVSRESDIALNQLMCATTGLEALSHDQRLRVINLRLNSAPN